MSQVKIINMQNKFMQIAIEEAQKSEQDIPVGAVIVCGDKVIAHSHNMKEQTNNITDHAEIIALKKASEILNNWRMEDCDMYVTLEPCPMCGWAIMQSRIKKLYFGSYDLKYGAFSCLHINKYSEFNTGIYGGISEDECDKIMKIFWNNKRNSK